MAGDDHRLAGPGGLSRGGIITLGTVLGLVTAMALTLLGLGVVAHAVANFDASAWLWSATNSELARVNGVTSRVDSRARVPTGRGHTMQVTQTDRYLILRDLATGEVSAIDLATLRVSATTRTTAGLGVSVTLHEDAAFVVDAVQGVVRQLDPRTLRPVGEPVHYPPGITGGVFDGDGRLWIAVPGEGTVSAVTPAPLPSGEAGSAGGGAGGAVGPTPGRALPVAAPSHDLTISALDNGVAVLDRTTSVLTVVRDGQRRAVPLGLTGPGSMPERTSGADVPVTVVHDRNVYVVNGDVVSQIAIPGGGVAPSPAVPWSGRLYVADDAAGTIYVLDTAGKLVDTIAVPGANGPMELEVRESYLFINAPFSATARVVDGGHQVRVVDKFADDLLGGDPPARPPAPPRPPREPQVGPPGVPGDVSATAGRGTARVSWQPAVANGAPVARYVVSGGGQTFQVGAEQRALEVTGLADGQTYRFTVHAVSAGGAGPQRTSDPVVPTPEVPGPPARARATAHQDGTVTVTWPAADGPGHAVRRYLVTAVSAGAAAPIGEATGTELVVPAGALAYGAQYAFAVRTVDDRGTGSRASPVSDSVVPYTVPAAPGWLDVTTVAGQPGALRAAWQPAAWNGRPLRGYVVRAGGQTRHVTDPAVLLTGFSDGQHVRVQVHAANAAGAGPAASATGRTVARPTMTVTGSSADYTSVTVRLAVDGGGGTTTCTVATAGRTAGGSCASLTVTGLQPGTDYRLTVTASNAAGSATAIPSQPTDPLYGTASCTNGSSGDAATYCDADRPGRNGAEIFSVPRQDNDRQVGWARPGTRLKAFCKAAGEQVHAHLHNNRKRSTWWVQVEYAGRAYLPFAWLNLDNGDDINALPTC